MNTIHLQQNEIEEMTGYKLPSCQVKVLNNLGIPSTRRKNNQLCVLRRDCTQFPANDAVMPKLKSVK